MSVEETHEFEIDPFTGQPRLVVNRKETIVQRRGGGSGSGGGSGTPGGSDTQLQYNNSSAFGGISNVTTDGTNLKFASGSTLNFGSGDVVLTHSSNNLTMTGGDAFTVNAGTGGKVIIGTLLNVGVMATYNDDTDSAASAVLGGGALLLGAGGSTGADVQLSRTAANVLTLASGDDLRIVTAGTDNTSVTVNAGSQTLTNKDISSSTNTYRAASDTATGAVELATAAETTTGTDATRAVTPDGLAGSDFGVRTIGLLVSDPGGSAITTGDGKVYARIPANMNGCNLIGVAASLSTVSSSGAVTVQVRRSRRTNATTRASADMLSTAITIDQSEFDTEDAATPAVINASNDDIVTGDHIYIDIDGAGTGAKGLFVALRFQLP